MDDRIGTQQEQVDEEPLIKNGYFDYQHLPAPLQEVSKRFHDLALWLTFGYARTPERTVALRKLLESKDAAVRNALPPR